MSSENNIVVKTSDKDGNDIELFIRTPGHKVLQEAQMVYNVKLTALIRQSIVDGSQLFSKEQLEQHLQELGIWTDKDVRKFLELQIEIRSSELKLKEGGIKVSEAKKIAIRMKVQRATLLSLYNRRSQFDGITMESMADNHRFNFLITKCVIHKKEDVPFFSNIQDYEKRQNEQCSVDAATALAAHLYGCSSDMEANLTENKWLKEFKFADDQGRLINDNGDLINQNGDLVDENGRFVDKDGNFVDNQGRRIDEDGNFIVEKPKPFIDDMGKSLNKMGKRNDRKQESTDKIVKDIVKPPRTVKKSRTKKK